MKWLEKELRKKKITAAIKYLKPVDYNTGIGVPYTLNNIANGRFSMWMGGPNYGTIYHCAITGNELSVQSSNDIYSYYKLNNIAGTGKKSIDEFMCAYISITKQNTDYQFIISVKGKLLGAGYRVIKPIIRNDKLINDEPQVGILPRPRRTMDLVSWFNALADTMWL